MAAQNEMLIRDIAVAPFGPIPSNAFAIFHGGEHRAGKMHVPL